VRAAVAGTERGVLLSVSAIMASLSLLTVAVMTGLPPTGFVALSLLTVTVAVGHRSLFAWHTLLSATLLVILLIPIRRYTMPGNLPFELEPYRLFVAFVAGLWLISLLIDPRVRVRGAMLNRPIALVVLAVVGSIIVNPARVATVDDIVSKKLTFLISFFLIFFLILSVVRRFVEVERLVKVLVLGGVVVAAFGIVEARTGFNVFNHVDRVMPFLQLSDLEGAAGIERGGRTRVFASSQHPIALGALLMMLCPLALYFCRSSKKSTWWWGALIVLGLGALSTLSRTGVIMLVVSLVVYLRVRPVETKRLWPLLIPAALLIHFAIPGTIGTFKDSFFPKGGLIAEQQKDAGTSGSGRVADLGPALSEAWKRPFLGQGYGTRVTTGPRANSMILDNGWLGMLLETGAIGVAAWIWLIVRFVRELMRAAKADLTERGWLYAGFAASVASFSVGMFTYDAFSFIQVTFVLFVLLALGSAALRARPRLAVAAEPRPQAPARLAPAERLSYADG
jgi:O-antigen ligase